MKYHEPVLLNAVIAHLKPEKDKKYIDATLGDGGHALEILERGGKVLGLDLTQESLNRATERIKNVGFEENFIGVRGNFKNIDQIAEENNFAQVNGIIYDLGFSSFQIDEEGFGLSFQKDEPLDMRLDKSLGVTAADLVNALSERELTALIYKFSDEKLARKFARAIVKSRKLKKIQTTKQLTDILVAVASLAYERGRIHPATRTFQALRIAVNNELENLEESLPRAARLLLPGGRLVVISFHSLEDKLVKDFGRGAQPSIRPLTKRPIVPTYLEVQQNVRARSAKMRVFEKQKP